MSDAGTLDADLPRACRAAECAEDEYCDFEDNTCGASGMGVCRSRLPPPGSECTAILLYVCACDGTTYAHPCDAWEAGADLDRRGGCPPPSDAYFGCGAEFCRDDESYCLSRADGDASCQSAFPPCDDCSCVVDPPCEGTCSLEDGVVTFRCED